MGTQLVWLSQSMSVVAEAVRDVQAIMDSYFLGAAERQILILNGNSLDGKQVEEITLEQLLSWVLHFVEVEGQALVREGGRLAVAGTVASTASQLEALVLSAVTASLNNTAFSRAGVTDSLHDLHFQLKQVKDFASQINPPML